VKALIIVLAILAILAWIPLKCRARYDGAPQVKVQVGPVRFTVYPGKEKKEKKPKVKIEKAPKEKKPDEPKKKTQITLNGIVQYVPLVQTALRALGRLIRSIAVRLKVHVTYGAADPADAALHYGQAWAIIGAVTPVLDNTFTIKKRDLQAVFDPEETGFTILAELTARIFVWQILAIAVSAGVKILIQFLKIRKGGANQ